MYDMPIFLSFKAIQVTVAGFESGPASRCWDLISCLLRIIILENFDAGRVKYLDVRRRTLSNWSRMGQTTELRYRGPAEIYIYCEFRRIH